MSKRKLEPTLPNITDAEAEVFRKICKCLPPEPITAETLEQLVQKASSRPEVSVKTYNTDKY
jgi:hypothetical protein